MTPHLLIALAIFAWTLPLPVLIQGLITVVLPVLVGLVTNVVTSAAKKAVLLLVLSIVSSGLVDFLAALNAGRAFDLGLWILGALLTFIGGVAVHYGLWKPTGVAAAAQDAIPATQPKVNPRDLDGDGRDDKTQQFVSRKTHE